MSRIVRLAVALLLCANFVLFAGLQRACAGSSTIGHGGNSVLCFSIPLKVAYQNDQMTEAGLRHIQSAVTYEYYIAQHAQPGNTELLRLQSTHSADKTRSFFLEKLKLVPAFYRAIQDLHQSLGPISEGFGFKEGLIPVGDLGNGIRMPENCAIIQTVIRQDDLFKYNLPVYGALDPLQRAILQLHEEIYAYGVAHAHQTSSVPTQLLLISLMTEPMTSAKLSAKLRQYGFMSPETSHCTNDGLSKPIQESIPAGVDPQIKKLYDDLLGGIGPFIDGAHYLTKLHGDKNYPYSAIRSDLVNTQPIIRSRVNEIYRYYMDKDMDDHYWTYAKMFLIQGGTLQELEAQLAASPSCKAHSLTDD